MMFLDILRRTFHRRRRAFLDVFPPAMDTIASSTLDMLLWRINVALHTPTTVGKVVSCVMDAAKPHGSFREIVTKMIEGDALDINDANVFVDVFEKAITDVLNDLIDVQSASAALRMPVNDVIRIALNPKQGIVAAWTGTE
jgi:hypothetical protein